MKKFLPFSLITLLSIVGTSCGGNNTPTSTSTSQQGDPKHVELIRDNKFKNGFTVSPSSGFRQDDGWQPENKWTRDVEIQYGTPDNKPSWQLAQHGDVYSLNDKYNAYVGEKPIDNKDGSFTFFDESKTITANPEKGSVYLELNTSKEYVRPRRAKEEWCHILLQQGFTQTISLGDVVSCDFTIDLEMKKFVDNMDGKADPSLHATQFLMYIVVQSSAGEDAGNWFWYGIPFFDNRYPTGLPESGMIDAGGAGQTGKFIYGMNSATYLPGGLQLNKKASISFDVAEGIGRALLYAQNKGYFLASTINDLTFSSMNIGFEIPGSYDCGIEISNYSLMANFE